jgi:hypothetical protein
MKRFLGSLVVVAVMAVAVPSALFAQSGGLTSYYKPGNVALGVDVGFGNYYSSLSVSGYPSFELFLAKFRIGDYLPLDIGVAVKGRLGLEAGFGGAGLDAGVGGFVTAHLGFRGLPQGLDEILGKVDLFVGLGPTLDILGYYTGLHFSEYSGFSYFINDNFAVTLSDTWWGYYYFDYTIGVRYKFGSSEAAMKSVKK